MTQNNNILQELKELGSTLEPAATQPAYTVPGGYFEQLADQVMARIRAMEAPTVVEEMFHLSPLVAGISKEMPHHLPAGYFENLESGLPVILQQEVLKQSASEELESISPLLSGMKKEMPFHVPKGYFDTINPKPAAKLVSISRSWFKYAAAAVVAGLFITGSIWIISASRNPEKSFARFEKKLEKEIEKTSDKELTEFLKYTDNGQDLAINLPKEETKILLKDVPATELQQFLDEIADPEIGTDETSLME